MACVYVVLYFWRSI